MRTGLGMMLVLVMAAAMSCPAATVRAQDAYRELPVHDIPERSAFAEDFPPLGWVVETSLHHELNGDGLEDTILLLIEDLPATVDGVPNERYRAMIILLATTEGDFRVVGIGSRIFWCTSCYGMLGGPEGGFPEISFHKNVLIVDQLAGAREMFNLTLRFRYHPDLDRMVLIGRDARLTDRLSAASVEESSNFITGRHIVTYSRPDQETGEEESRVEESRIMPSALPIDSVDVDRLGRTPTHDDIPQ